MNILLRVRPLLVSLSCAALTVLALGTAIVEGWHEPAARYLDAECRGFDALVMAGDRRDACVKPASDTLGAKAPIVVDVSAAVPAFLLPEA